MLRKAFQPRNRPGEGLWFIGLIAVSMALVFMLVFASLAHW